ncbi:unnamed protein product [Parnassius mnemosyne]|uniref:Uncharacterized protein n=1 Tax=Parnassius mnemosyne TaxID=213953 RepID=A0AAV1KRX1_9NEOP
MKSISFFVEPSGLDQVHFLWGRFWKKEFIIKSPSFSMKSASCWSLGFLCPIPNFPTFSSPFSLVPSFALVSHYHRIVGFGGMHGSRDILIHFLHLLIGMGRGWRLNLYDLQRIPFGDSDKVRNPRRHTPNLYNVVKTINPTPPWDRWSPSR